MYYRSSYCDITYCYLYSTHNTTFIYLKLIIMIDDRNIVSQESEGLEVTELGVYKSAAGYYVGRYCNAGPYSRNSEYFPTHKLAQAALDEYKTNYNKNN